MHQYHLAAMLRQLQPVLKSRKRAEMILTKFWSDKIALLWHLYDVHRAANEKGVALTRTEALQVLHELHQHHNPQLGLRWEDFTAYIEEYGLGRKLTRAETKRFVEKDHITIQR